MRGRSGFALPAALVSIILIAALLAALFFAVTEETRTTAAIARRDRALAAAESALETSLEEVATRAHGGVGVAVGTVASHALEVEGLPVVVHITSLDSSLFWLVAAVGDAADPTSATRRIGLLVAASADPSGAMTIKRVPAGGWSELF